MPRSITRAGSIFLAVATCLVTGCFSGGYDKDFQARLQDYKRAAAGEPPLATAADAEGQPADPPAEAGAE